jgi:hypothetical protein
MGDRHLAAAVLVAMVSIFLGVSFFYAQSLPDEGWFYPILLFGLPFILLAVSRTEIGQETFLRNSFIWIVMVCVVLNAVFWVLYTVQEAKHWLAFSALEALAWFSFLVASLLVALVFYVTKVMIKQRESEMRDGVGNATSSRTLAKFCDEIRQHRFLCLLFFLTVFLYVTFFLGFSMAFHDHGSWGPGLVADIVDPEPNHQEVAGEGASAAKTADLEEASPGSKAAGAPDIWQLCFDEYSADLKYNILFKDANPETSRPELQQEIRNTRVLKEIVAKTDDQRGLYRRVRLTVIGRANDNPMPCSSKEAIPSYRSDFELSMARAYQAQYALSRYMETELGARYGELNLEWLLIPVGTEEVFDLGSSPLTVTEASSQDEEERDRKLCADVMLTWIPGHLSEAEMKSFKQPHEFELFDYLYFMVYTITTTGYGDIKPVSTEAKFFASIANLYELFFLVIFVNVLLSFGRPEGTQGSGSSSASEPTP